MTPPREDDLPPELLAAYADGELPPDLVERVARWLAADPEALRMGDEQAGLSPTNEFLMDELAVPMPTPREWAACQAGIRGELAKPRRDYWGVVYVAAGLAVAGVLATVWLGALNHRFAPMALVLPAEESDEEMLVLASPGDVEILSLHEEASSLLLVGDLPWNEDVILAKAYELEYIGVGSDADGRFPAVPTDPTADDAPLLWAPAPP